MQASGRPQRTKRFRGIEDKSLITYPVTVAGSPNGSHSDYEPAGVRTGKGRQPMASAQPTGKPPHGKAVYPTTIVQVTHQQLQQQLYQKEHASHALPDMHVGHAHCAHDSALANPSAAFPPGSVPQAARYKLLADGIAARGECAVLPDHVQHTADTCIAQNAALVADAHHPTLHSPPRGRKLGNSVAAHSGLCSPAFSEGAAERSLRQESFPPYDTISRSPVFGEVAAEMSPRRDPFTSYAASMPPSSPRKFSLSPISRQPTAGEDAAEISPRRDPFSTYDMPMPKVAQRKLSLSPVQRPQASGAAATAIAPGAYPRRDMSLLSALSPPRSVGVSHPGGADGFPPGTSTGGTHWNKVPPADGSENIAPKCTSWGASNGNSAASGAAGRGGGFDCQQLDGFLDEILEPPRTFRNSPTHPLLAPHGKLASHLHASTERSGAPISNGMPVDRSALLLGQHAACAAAFCGDSQRRPQSEWELSFSQLPSVPLTGVHIPPSPSVLSLIHI